MSIAAFRHGAIRLPSYPNRGPALPKNVWVRFTLDHALAQGERVRWTVINEGDEAEASRDMGHTSEGRDAITWEATKYRGDHRMRCELLRSGDVVATCERVVRIR
ncbi:MAG: hypothetical protein M3Y87_00905 [Myxococcota bacterium]|nr:hypothetical protein [Myxococcota bacterium]